jgi:hypothetical protein
MTPWYWGETPAMYELRTHYFYNNISVYTALTKIVQDTAHARYLKKKKEDEAKNDKIPCVPLKWMGESDRTYKWRCELWLAGKFSEYGEVTKLVIDEHRRQVLKKLKAKEKEDSAIEKFINKFNHEANRTCPATLTPLGGRQSTQRCI